MKIFSKALCVAALAVAAAPFAKADTKNQINFIGNDTYCLSATCGSAVYGDVDFGTAFVGSAFGTFSPFAGGNVVFNDFNFTSTTTPFDLFTVANTAATEELVYTVTSLNAVVSGSDGTSLTITGGGYYTLINSSTSAVIAEGNMNFTSQGGGDSFSTTFSDSNTITPEPSSLMLLGTGLVTAAGMLTRRRRVVA